MAKLMNAFVIAILIAVTLSGALKAKEQDKDDVDKAVMCTLNPFNPVCH